MPDEADALLHIYVIGASIGESIIVGLPDGKWGVVDCYSSSTKPERNTTLQFLRKKLGVDELEFLCLTHPHYDHYHGMGQLLEGIPTVRSFWQFAEMCGEDLVRLLCVIERSEGSEAKASELGDLLNKVDGLELNGDIGWEFLQGVHRVYPVATDIDGQRAETEVWTLAPTSPVQTDYRRKIVDCVDHTGSVLGKLPSTEYHNNISIALLVRYGATHVILCGDTTGESWDHTLPRTKNKESALSARFIKVGHHGSENANPEHLWELFSSGGKPVAVVTPFSPQSLPRPDMLTFLNQNTSTLLSTCPDAIGKPKARFDIPGPNAEKTLAGLIGASCKSFTRKPKYPVGICHLAFDDKGNHTIELMDGAGEVHT